MVPLCEDLLSKSALQGMLRDFFLATSHASCPIPSASQHFPESNLAQLSAHIGELRDNAAAFLSF